MRKLPQIICITLLGLFAGTASAQAQTIKNLPPWMNKRPDVTSPQPAPQSYPTNAPVEVRTADGRVVRSRDRNYRSNTYRKGHPHGLPPGQAKKMGYRANPSNGGLPPGQAKKMGAHGRGKH